MDIFLQIFFIILGIVIIPVGFLGGRWLWQKMAQSPLLTRVQKFIRPIGIIGTVAMFTSSIACLGAVMLLPCSTLFDLAKPLSMGGSFLLGYLVGYDVSIIKNQKFGNADQAPITLPEASNAFHIRWELVRQVFFHIFLVFSISYLVLAVFAAIRWDLFFDLLLVSVGGSLGYLFWEHLKNTGYLVGTFLKQLLILSLATTGFMAFFFWYSIYVTTCSCPPDPQILFIERNPQILFISLALFTECLGWFMLSLPITLRHLNTAPRLEVRK